MALNTESALPMFGSYTCCSYQGIIFDTPQCEKTSSCSMLSLDGRECVKSRYFLSPKRTILFQKLRFVLYDSLLNERHKLVI